MTITTPTGPLDNLTIRVPSTAGSSTSTVRMQCGFLFTTIIYNPISHHPVTRNGSFVKNVLKILTIMMRITYFFFFTPQITVGMMHPV